MSAGSSADELLLELAHHFGAPLSVLDLAEARRRAADLRTALPAGAVLLYSLKANPLPPLVAALRAAGCGAEVSSPTELATALEGGASTPVLYTGPGKSEQEIGTAIDRGALLSCESRLELARVASSAGVPAGLETLIRVQPSSRPAAGLSMSDGRQFGFSEDEAVAAIRRPPAGIAVAGLHCFLGSQLPTPDALLQGFADSLAVMERICDACGWTPSVVDVGGGFPWPYAAGGSGPDLSPLQADLEQLLRPWTAAGTAVWFESGRRLAAAAGQLVTRVVDVKRRPNGPVVVVDAGVNVLGGMSGLGRVLRPAAEFRNLSSPDRRGAERVDVVGPLCTPLDRLAAGTEMPEPLPDEVLCVDNVGAYGSTAALSAFLQRPAPLEVVLEGAEVVGVWQLRNRHAAVEAAPAPGGRA